MLSKIQDYDSVVQSFTDIRQTDSTSYTQTAGYAIQPVNIIHCIFYFTLYTKKMCIRNVSDL